MKKLKLGITGYKALDREIGNDGSIIPTNIIGSFLNLEYKKVKDIKKGKGTKSNWIETTCYGIKSYIEYNNNFKDVYSKFKTLEEEDAEQKIILLTIKNVGIFVLDYACNLVVAKYIGTHYKHRNAFETIRSNLID